MKRLWLAIVAAALLLPPAFAQDARSPTQLLRDSRAALAAGQLDTALERAQAATRADPAFPDGWKQLGRVQMLRGEHLEALRAFRSYLEMAPADRDLHAWVIETLIALDRPQELRQALEAIPDEPLRALGGDWAGRSLYTLLEGGRHAEAGVLVARWARFGAQPALDGLARAVRHLAAGDVVSATRELRASSAQPGTAGELLAGAWTHLGREQLEAGRPTEAIVAFEQALKLRPRWPPALRELGWAYRASGQPARAAQAWNEGVAQARDPAQWLMWIAEARLAAGETKPALDALDRLLAAQPGHEAGRILRLAMLINRDSPAAARAEAELRAGPDGERLVVLAQAAADRMAGRYARAIERLEPLLKREPPDTAARRQASDTLREWARTAHGAERTAALERCTVFAPERADGWRDLGWSYWEQGQRDQAIAAWDRALGAGLPNRRRLVMQVVARMAEEGDGERAVALHRRWLPGQALLPMGMELVNARRTLAAEPLLAAAWTAGEDPRTSGLYLAYVEGQANRCRSLSEHLAPFLKSNLSSQPRDRLEMALEALAVCSDEPALQAPLEQLTTALAGRPEFGSRLAALLARAAAARENARDPVRAFDLYRQALERNPDLPVWLKAARLGEELGRGEEAARLLDGLLARTHSVAVREGIHGFRAGLRGERDRAVTHYRASLAAEPNQPDLRLLVMADLLALGRDREARQEVAWLEQRFAGGDSTVQSHLAEARRALGETGEALRHWEELAAANPRAPHYGIESARLLYERCRAPEAVRQLETLVRARPDPRAYELLAEIVSAQGDARKALDWTTEGLKPGPHRGLLRLRAEAAEVLGDPAAARAAAEALLAMDPANTIAARIRGQALLDQGDTATAKSHYQALLAHNPQFLPALVKLKDIASAQGDAAAAVDYAARIERQRPWDPAARQRLAIARAEAVDFHPALEALRAEAAREARDYVPVLVYSRVTSCDYPGRVRSAQVAAHIRRLAAEDYRLVGPDGLDVREAGARALVVLTQAEPAALKEVDGVLAAVGGRAVYAAAGNEARSRAVVEALKTGRWALASGDMSDLTHRQRLPGGAETDAAFGARLGAQLARAVEVLPAQRRLILVYPGGDYGQLALGTEETAVATLRARVEQHFALGIAADDDGFVAPGYDPLRIPGRFVSPGWDAEALAAHLRRQHPAGQAPLQLAKVLYWQGQHESAEHWFARAAAFGVEPADLYYHWGVNADRSSDVPRALERQRQAQVLEPQSVRVAEALEQAEWRARPRLTFTGGGWADSDDRSYRRASLEFGLHAREDLEVSVFAERHRWEREGFGKEEGTGAGAGLQWYFRPGSWLVARAWRLEPENLDAHSGGLLDVHLPLADWSGSLDLSAGRNQIDTVEAVRAGILANDLTAQLHSRLRDTWDLYATFSRLTRSDDNDGWLADGRLVYRLAEWPFLGLGYRFRLGDNDREVPEYWSPQRLRQHQLYAAWRGEGGAWRYSLSGEAGYAQEVGTDWRFVWGGRLRLEFLLGRRFSLTGELRRLETPSYDRNDLALELEARF